MKFEKTEVWGFEHALRGMRNPMNSWNKSDTKMILVNKNDTWQEEARIGENDMKLAQSLIKAGEPHRKFLRQIFVSVDITAPLYWWKEFDTYKVGTVANSTSTMHKLASTPITKDCFEMSDFMAHFESDAIFGTEIYMSDIWEAVIEHLEKMRISYNKNMETAKEKNMTEQERNRMITIAKRYWKELIRLLPESWLQTRTVTMNYENILNMITYRKNHKLTEWSKDFIEWAESLPYAEEFLFYKGE